MIGMPRREKKELKPPSPAVAEAESGFLGVGFDRALDRATRQVEPDASERDPKSPKT
jgi:hypothetical protein